MTDQTIPAGLTRDEAFAVREWAEQALATEVQDVTVVDVARVILDTVPAPAPVLAATVAGMHEEWGREARITGDTEWHIIGWCRSRAEAELTDWMWSIPKGATIEYRLVRRYVTEPEEA